MNQNSTAALRSIDRKALQTKVLDYITDCGFYGTTTDQIEEALNLAHQTVSPRVLELREQGQIFRTGTKRPTRRRRMADVYCASKLAQERLAQTA